MTLAALRNGQVFREVPLSRDSSGVSFMVRRGMGFQEEDHRGEVPFLSHPVTGPCCHHDLSRLTLTLIKWLPGFSTVRVLVTRFGGPNPKDGVSRPAPRRQRLYLNYS